MVMAKRAPEPSACVFGGDTEQYRYRLEHIFDPTQPSYVPKKTALWVMLNPSSANLTSLDPTLRKCKQFSLNWGCTNMLIVNLFAYRSAAPEAMKIQADPIGPDNDHHIMACARRDDISVIVAGWGAHGKHLNRAAQVTAMLAGLPLMALKYNKDGSPQHPLYIPYSAVLHPYPEDLHESASSTVGPVIPESLNPPITPAHEPPTSPPPQV